MDMLMSECFKDPLQLPPSQPIQPSKLLDGDNGVEGEPSTADSPLHGDFRHHEDRLLLHLLLPLLRPPLGLLLVLPPVPRRMRGVDDRAPRLGEPRPHPLLHRIGVDVGELPLGVEGEGRRGSAAAAAAGEAASWERQEARGLEQEHDVGGLGLGRLVAGSGAPRTLRRFHWMGGGVRRAWFVRVSPCYM